MIHNIRSSRALLSVDTKLRVSTTFGQVLIWIFVLSFALDYRGEEGGSVLQLVFLGVLLAAWYAFFLGVFLARDRLRAPKALSALVAIWTFALIASLPVAYFAGIPLDRYVRVATPYLLFALSASFVLFAHIRGFGARHFIRPILVAAAINVAWVVIRAWILPEIDFISGRYRIISPATYILLAWVLSAVATRQKMRLWESLSLAAILVLVVLSMTRALLVTVLVAILLAVVIRLSFRHRRAGFSGVPLLMTLVASVAAVAVLRPDFVSAWQGRLGALFRSDVADITLVTRLAEWKAQLQSFATQASSLAFGRGFGSQYTWDPAWYAQLVPVYGDVGSNTFTYWYAGHSLWVYTLYALGLVLGLPVLASILFVIARSISLLRGRAGEVSRRLATWLFLCCVLFLVLSVTGNPFVYRLPAALFGMISGLVLICPTARARKPRLGLAYKSAVSVKSQGGVESASPWGNSPE